MVMSKVLIEVDGPVRTVTLNRPDKRNALDNELLDGLVDAFPPDPGPTERVAVLRANGPAFCSGMDLNQRKESLGKPASIETMLRAVENFPLPVVAVVHGHAIAGGNELALHCDFVVASRAANFGMSLAQIGLAPTWFLMKKLVEVAGPVAAREIILLGDPLPAQRMHEFGIIARVAEPDELDAAAKKIIDRLAANAPLSLKIMKRTIVRQMGFWHDMDAEDINAEVREVSASADAREGITARLERRSAQFRGE
jgi:enoyl-CoA hydratase/carnithine racemase